MKRFLAVLMLVVMMCGCVGLAEEGKTFDPSVLEGKDGYSYDKFEKTWTYQAVCGRGEEGGNTYLIALLIQGQKNQIETSILMFAVEEGDKLLDGLTKMAIVADDKLITVDKVLSNEGVTGIRLTKKCTEMLENLELAKNISIRFYTQSATNGHCDIEVQSEDFDSVRDALKLVLEYELFDDEQSGEKITIESVE